MATEKDFELLDDYLTNRLSGEEKIAFEKKLEADPGFKSEFVFQQKLIQEIKNTRITGLKAMLNNVPVPPVQDGQTSVFGKAALWVGGMAIVGAGIYLFLNPATEAPVQTTISANEITQEKNQPKNSIPESTPVVSENVSPVTPDVQKNETKKSSKTNAAKTKDTGKEENSTDRSIQVFDPSDEQETDNAYTPEKTETKSGKNEPVLVSSSIVVETDNTNKKYTFHYQFKNEKLYLYGPFEKDLYEILEFFSNNKRTAFLFHNKNYYLLNEDDDTIRLLVPITDPALLSKLQDYRGK